jgi:hypothetical protein
MTENTRVVPMFRFKNAAKVALPIPELNMLVPAGGYSAPMTESTPTVDAYLSGNLFVRESMNIPEMASAHSEAIAQGSAPANDTAGVIAPVTAGPQLTTVATPPAKLPDRPTKPGADYIDLRVSAPTDKIKSYDNQAAVRDAISNTVVSIGTGGQPINQFGEIPQEEANKLLRAQGKGKGNFSVEVSSGDYIADEARNIIASANGVVSAPKPETYKMPEGLPPEMQPFFRQTALQKKIFIYKSASVDVLNAVKVFEKDPNVLSCIDQRLGELGK